MSNQDETKPAKAENGGLTKGAIFRQGTLIVVFLGVVACGIYEYVIARPQFNQMLINLEDMNSSEMGTSFDSTNEEVRKVLKREPKEVESLNGDAVLLERYTINRGLPFTRFNLYVWYTKGAGIERNSWIYAGHQSRKQPDASQLPRKTGQDVVVSSNRNLQIQIGAGGINVQRPNPFEQPESEQENEAADDSADDSPQEKSATEDDSAVTDQDGKETTESLENNEGDADESNRRSAGREQDR